MGGTEEVRKRVHEEERDVGSRHHLRQKRLRVLCNSVIFLAWLFITVLLPVGILLFRRPVLRFMLWSGEWLDTSMISYRVRDLAI